MVKDGFYLAPLKGSVPALVKVLEYQGSTVKVQFFKAAPYTRGIYRAWGEPEYMSSSDLILQPEIPPPLPPKRRSTGEVLLFNIETFPKDLAIR